LADLLWGCSFVDWFSWGTFVVLGSSVMSITMFWPIQGLAKGAGYGAGVKTWPNSART